ncbi:hypothetical protein ACJJTC_004650 [Scirpophaga incertulas]
MLTKLTLIFLLTLQFDDAWSQQQEGDTCVDDQTNSLGVCKPSDSCVTAKINYEKSRIFPTFCKYSAFGPTLVCCRDGNTVVQTPRPRTADPQPLFKDPNDNRRISEKKCDAYSRQVVRRVDITTLHVDEDDGVSLAASQCPYTGVDLIIGGENALVGEFPHMAAIGWPTFEGFDFKCGGSLISTRYVLTAGHCTRDAGGQTQEPVVVRLGDQNIDSSIEDGAKPIDVAIRNIIKHPEYNPPVVYHDIALLELVTDVKFSSNIRPACLWTREDYGKNNKGIATGWGVINIDTQETSKELQKVSLSLLDNRFCDRILEHIKNRHWHGFVPSQMCAGELRGGKDTCQGDSGSPIQVTSKTNRCIFYVLGLTSFGKKCGVEGLPAIYTRVSSYIDWIESVVWPGE